MGLIGAIGTGALDTIATVWRNRISVINLTSAFANHQILIDSKIKIIKTDQKISNEAVLKTLDKINLRTDKIYWHLINKADK